MINISSRVLLMLILQEIGSTGVFFYWNWTSKVSIVQQKWCWRWKKEWNYSMLSAWWDVVRLLSSLRNAVVYSVIFFDIGWFCVMLFHGQYLSHVGLQGTEIIAICTLHIVLRWGVNVSHTARRKHEQAGRSKMDYGRSVTAVGKLSAVGVRR